MCSMLMAPPKPDLEGFKAEVMGSEPLIAKFELKSIQSWNSAGNIVAAKAMVSRKFYPNQSGCSRAIYDAYNRWGHRDTVDEKYSGTRVEIREAVEKAVMKTVKGFFTDQHPAIKRKISDEHLLRGFCVGLTLGYSGSPFRNKVLFNEYILLWSASTDAANKKLRERRDLLPEYDDTGCSAEFLLKLIEDDVRALTLAKYGFQNMVIVEGKHVVLIPMTRCALTMVRNRLRPHSLTGPAVVMKTKKKYFINGVDMNAINTRWRKMPSVYLDFVDTENGKIKPGKVRDILKVENTEWRRVLLEQIEPEELLRECKADRIDGPTELGNELFRVDIGITPSWREGYPWEKDPKERKQRANFAHMLRYKCPSTDRVYVKFVPEEYNKADEAQAWSHHFTLDEYKALEIQS